jgi:hypothetical protein
MSRITVALFTALTCLSINANADGLTGEAGLGLSYEPHDPTGSRYETRPVPYLDLDWGDVSLGTDDGLTWSAFKANGFSAGPFANYLPGRTANGTLRGLRDVPDMAEVGGSCSTRRPTSGGCLPRSARQWAAAAGRVGCWEGSVARWVIRWVAG